MSQILNKTLPENQRKAMRQIKHSSQQIIMLDDAIRKAEDEIEANAGKEAYINTRHTAIKFWLLEKDSEEFMLAETFKQYEQYKPT